MDSKPVNSKFENDLSKGNVVKQLLVFALPFLLSNFLQSLYSVVDMVIVGQFSGMQSMSGVNIGGQVTLVATNLVIGLGAGATVLIGQYLGYKARREMKETIGTLFTTLLIVAVFLTGIMLIFRAPILRALSTPAEAFSEAMDYLLVTSAGLIFIFGYNAFSAVMRGLGDSKRPLIFVAIACVTNIGLDILFVARFNMMAFGAALATIISQALSMILCFIYLKRNDFVFDFKWASFKINRKKARHPDENRRADFGADRHRIRVFSDTDRACEYARSRGVGRRRRRRQIQYVRDPAGACGQRVHFSHERAEPGRGSREARRQDDVYRHGDRLCDHIVVSFGRSCIPNRSPMFTSEPAVIAAGAANLKTYTSTYSRAYMIS
jgi:hypothetical protein